MTRRLVPGLKARRVGLWFFMGLKAHAPSGHCVLREASIPGLQMLETGGTRQSSRPEGPWGWGVAFHGPEGPCSLLHCRVAVRVLAQAGSRGGSRGLQASERGDGFREALASEGVWKWQGVGSSRRAESAEE